MDCESPYQDGDADMFNFRKALMMVQRQLLCGRVARRIVRLATTQDKQGMMMKHNRLNAPHGHDEMKKKAREKH